MTRIHQLFFFAITIFLFSCKTTDEDFTSVLYESNLDALIQTFTIDLDVAGNSVRFETDAGCSFRFSKGGFKFEGEPVTGTIDIEVIEIFDKGTMAITGKHTMTDESILISGGEFFVKAYQDDNELDYEYTYRIEVPVELSGTFSEDMQLFTGGESRNSSQTWVSVPNNSDIWGVFGQSDTTSYMLFVSDFQWFNCDRFQDDPRPLIELDIKFPSQFDQENSAVYLAIKGEPSSLGVATWGRFPLGLDAHLIFVSEVDKAFLYQIISGPLSEDGYKFERDKMQSATSSELKDIINGLE